MFCYLCPEDSSKNKTCHPIHDAKSFEFLRQEYFCSTFTSYTDENMSSMITP